MTLKIKMVQISILEVGFENFFDSHLQNCIGKLKMIRTLITLVFEGCLVLNQN